MKNKRKMILGFVLIALLLIGIGYAAISDTLDVRGSVTTDYAELDLVFTQVKVVSSTDVQPVRPGLDHADLGSSQGIADQTTDESSQAYWNIDDDLVNLSVHNMAYKGDEVVFELTIQNISAADDMIAKFNGTEVDQNTKAVEVVVTSDHEEWFTVTASLSALEVAQGQAVTLTVTVHLNESVSEENVDATFTIDLTGQYAMEHQPA